VYAVGVTLFDQKPVSSPNFFDGSRLRHLENTTPVIESHQFICPSELFLVQLFKCQSPSDCGQIFKKAEFQTVLPSQFDPAGKIELRRLSEISARDQLVVQIAHIQISSHTLLRGINAINALKIGAVSR
jgi:hypothetical protein